MGAKSSTRAGIRTFAAYGRSVSAAGNNGPFYLCGITDDFEESAELVRRAVSGGRLIRSWNGKHHVVEGGVIEWSGPDCGWETPDREVRPGSPAAKRLVWVVGPVKAAPGQA